MGKTYFLKQKFLVRRLALFFIFTNILFFYFYFFLYPKLVYWGGLPFILIQGAFSAASV